MVEAVEILAQRILSGVALAGVLGYGGYATTAAADASKQRVSEIRSREQSADQAEAKAMARDLRFKADERYYLGELNEDYGKFGLDPMSIDALRKPNRAFHPIRKPMKLKPGRGWASKHVRVRASIEKVTFQQHGAKIAAKHAVATIKNISKVPIAYFMKVTSADLGECPTRGARSHNAMALRPGESAEVVVCAGKGSVLVNDLRVMEITPIGYVYLSMVPPQAVGHDAVTSRAHRPDDKIPSCSSVPAVQIARGIRSGQFAWEDVVDFYSRHNCDRFQYVHGYKMATGPVEQLPVTSVGGAAPGDSKAAAEG